MPSKFHHGIFYFVFAPKFNNGKHWIKTFPDIFRLFYWSNNPPMFFQSVPLKKGFLLKSQVPVSSMNSQILTTALKASVQMSHHILLIKASDLSKPAVSDMGHSMHPQGARLRRSHSKGHENTSTDSLATVIYLHTVWNFYPHTLFQEATRGCFSKSEKWTKEEEDGGLKKADHQRAGRFPRLQVKGDSDDSCAPESRPGGRSKGSSGTSLGEWNGRKSDGPEFTRKGFT